MKRLVFVLCFAVGLASVASYMIRTRVQAAGVAGHPCTSFVPKEWGQFRGASSYGMEFEDSEGTIRFIKNPPCDPTFTARADLELRRQR